jgi:hypothetical protein
MNYLLETIPVCTLFILICRKRHNFVILAVSNLENGIFIIKFLTKSNERFINVTLKGFIFKQLMVKYLSMENDWKAIQKYIQSQFNIKPDVYNILFLIGVQELGYGFQQFDQTVKTKVINFASMYIMNYLDDKDKEGLKQHSGEDEHYEQEIYKKAIINYFKFKKIF